MKNVGIHLKDSVSAMESIERFVANMDFEKFKKDDKTSSAVIRKFEIIGEAAKRIPAEYAQKYPQIPWKEMAGMRDRLIHLYSEIDYKLVWATIAEKLPRLLLLFKKLIAENIAD